jgi:predicted nucleic acid-binding protein
VTLVDTTVWIDWLRGKETGPTRALALLLEEGEAALCPVILQELLQGAVNAAALRTLRSRFGALPMLVPLPPVEQHALAGELYARARWSGVTPRSPHDCLVAATAVAAGVPLLHDDRDFVTLARVERRLRLARH